MKNLNKILYIFCLITSLSAGFVTKLSAQSLLSLEQAREKALQNNHRIQESNADIQAAQKGYEVASTAQFPQIAATGSAYYLTNRPSDLFPSFIGNVGLGAQYQLYGGDRVKNSMKAAQIQIEAAETQKQLSEAELVLAVDQNYWEIIRLREQVSLANENISFLEALYGEIKNYYDAGLIQKNDMLETQVSLNQAKLRLLQAQQGESLARYSLAQKMGLEKELNFNLPDSIDIKKTDTLSWQQVLDQALGQREELVLLKQNLKLTEVQSQIDDAAYRPQASVALNALYSYSPTPKSGSDNQDAPALFNEHFVTLYPQLSINIPLYQAGRRKRIQEQYTATLQAQRESLRENEEQIALQIRQAAFQLNESAENIKLSQISILQADENLQLLQNQFEAGTVTGKDVLEAQAIKQQAYAAYINAKAQHQINQSYYLKAIGSIRK